MEDDPMLGILSPSNEEKFCSQYCPHPLKGSLAVTLNNQPFFMDKKELNTVKTLCHKRSKYFAKTILRKLPFRGWGAKKLH